VAARKKSEETQDLAADAHRNLEHALPSLDAAMQVHNSGCSTWQCHINRMNGAD
jgi:hypothetical protein